MSLEYTLELIIERPRSEVVALFDNSENLKEWLPGLVSLEPLEGAPGQTGSTARLVFDERGRKLEMVETITERSLPDRFCASYECGSVFNTVENEFEELGDGRTRWKTKNVFRLGGFMRIMGIFMKGAFPKQSLTHMQRFKTFAEKA